MSAIHDRIDSIAEAIYTAANADGDAHEWAQCRSYTLDRYRRMAQAAVDSLQLTPQWIAHPNIGSPSQTPDVRDNLGGPFTRLASPWVRSS